MDIGAVSGLQKGGKVRIESLDEKMRFSGTILEVTAADSKIGIAETDQTGFENYVNA